MRQRDDLVRAHARELAELKLSTELQQARLTEEFHAQLELIRAEKEKEQSELHEILLRDTADVRRQAKEQADNDAEVLCTHS